MCGLRPHILLHRPTDGACRLRTPLPVSRVYMRLRCRTINGELNQSIAPELLDLADRWCVGAVPPPLIWRGGDRKNRR